MRNIALGLVLIVCMIAVAGCGGGSGGSTTPPISLTGISFKETPIFAGGQVTINAQVNQGSVVSSIIAQVTLPDSSLVDVPFTSQGNGGYTAVYKAPTNSTYLPKTYRIVVTVKDTAGKSAVADPFTFTVQGLVQPPIPPPVINP